MTAAFDDLSPTELEHAVAKIWRRRGWQATVSPQSSDGGVDVVAKRENPFPEKQLLQVKHYDDGNPVSAPEIQQYAGLQHQHPDADTVIVVTSGRFSTPAEETAREANVKLVDGDELEGMAREVGLVQGSNQSEKNSIVASTRTQPAVADGSGGLPEQIQEILRAVIIALVAFFMLYILWQSGLLL